MARPSKYTPELVARICTHVMHGAPLDVAAQAEGTSAASLQRWQQRYPAVRAQIVRARALCVTTCLGHLNAAGARGDWRPAAWLLERLAPQDFGPPRLRVQLEALSPAQLETLSDEQLEALIADRSGTARPRLLPPKEAS